MVLEGVENMGSTGGIRAISLAFAQNWSGPTPPSSGPEMAAITAVPSASLCLCVFFRFFFSFFLLGGDVGLLCLVAGSCQEDHGKIQYHGSWAGFFFFFLPKSILSESETPF